MKPDSQAGGHNSSRDLAPDTCALRPQEPQSPGTIVALLRAAKPRGLLLWHNLQWTVCWTSETPNKGWYARSSWSARDVDWRYGGPWSVEFAVYVAGLGLIGVDPHDRADTAQITKAGRAYLKAADAGASPSPPSSEGDKSPEDPNDH